MDESQRAFSKIPYCETIDMTFGSVMLYCETIVLQDWLWPIHSEHT